MCFMFSPYLKNSAAVEYYVNCALVVGLLPGFIQKRMRRSMHDMHTLSNFVLILKSVTSSDVKFII